MSRNSSEIFPKSTHAVPLRDLTFLTDQKQLVDATGVPVHLRRQSAEVLAYLLAHAGQTVSKDTLFAAVWADAAVTDDSLVQCISDIRRALGDHDHTLIQTRAKQGYALVLPAVPHPSIAVLAFEDFSAGADHGYLSDAVAEGVIAGLSRFSELAVIARNSSFSFRDTPTNIDDIARTLGVRYVLEGSQQKSGDRLRITAQLIDAANGFHLWSEVYDDDLSDLFTVQDDIVRRVVATVAQKVFTHEARPSTSAPDAKRTALLHHLDARQHLHKLTPESNERARQANLAAIKADPTQPFGHAGLAFVHINGYRWGWTTDSRENALEKAREAARTAVTLGPDYYDSHAAMAYVHLQDNDLDRAIARARRALALNPNDTFVMCDLAEFLGYAGQAEEAERLLDKVVRLDPLHQDWVRWNIAWVQWLNKKYDRALHTLHVMTELPPMAYRVLAIVHISLGQHAAAQDAIKHLLAFDPGYSMDDVRQNYCGKFRNASDLDTVLDHLRAAGLPEHRP